MRGEGPANPELAEDQARQASLSRVMHETNLAGVQAERAQRQHMVAEFDLQRAEGDHERTDAALAAAEAERLPPRSTLPLAEPTPSGPPQRRWGLARHAGWMGAGIALLSLVVVGSVFLVRQRRH